MGWMDSPLWYLAFPLLFIGYDAMMVFYNKERPPILTGFIHLIHFVMKVGEGIGHLIVRYNTWRTRYKPKRKVKWKNKKR